MLLDWIKRFAHRQQRSPYVSIYKYKQVILVNTSLGMSKGKTAAQVAHASVRAALETHQVARRRIEEWLATGEAKIVLKVKDAEEMLAYVAMAQALGIPSAAIRDEGLTEVPADSWTAAAIGPIEREELDIITGDLKTL